LFDIPLWLAALALVAALGLMEHFRRSGSAMKRHNEAMRNDLAASRLEVVASEKARSELLSRIGSSLRKPLASIRNAAEEVSRPFDCPDWVREQLALLSSEVETISRFIDLIGEIASLERPREDAAAPSSQAGPKVDLEEIFTSIINEASSRLAEKGISLAAAIDPGVMVKGDERYIRQALESLLGETIRHAGRGSILHIDLSRTDSGARFSCDYRGSPDPDATGSVLGMELARQVISVHGGWLQEGSRKGQFSAGLPLAAEESRMRKTDGDEPEYLQEV
jgi:two-component system, OmpR family, sensor histidine kinase SenX3